MVTNNASQITKTQVKRSTSLVTRAREFRGRARVRRSQYMRNPTEPCRNYAMVATIWQSIKYTFPFLVTVLSTIVFFLAKELIYPQRAETMVLLFR